MFDLHLTNENLIVLGGIGSGLVAATAIFVALFVLTGRYFQIVKEQAGSSSSSSTDSGPVDSDSKWQSSKEKWEGDSSQDNSSTTWTKEDQEGFDRLREEQERVRRERETRERTRREREEQETARRRREEQERAKRQREEWERYRREREARNARTSAPPPNSGPTKPHPFEKEYTILGLKPGASRSDLRRAWTKMVKQVHPDVNKSPDAGEKFKELHKAYEMLMQQLRK